ncbi:Nuclear receptor 2C2-associated protein [Astathelohania contejeani]|uniref:Nuclear receptor 2C2-associated protein n=1 Tax=Astathelohania contejeani TaxID=164912 RepID=A0ABQ7HYJ4_9MICR|nr:Nuclear receptor 2C2-associated protein [Thelohania contejeani]
MQPIEIFVSSAESTKMNLFDKKEDTCWFSGHGSPQFIKLKFHTKIFINEIKLSYQLGFHCKKGKVKINNSIIHDLNLEFDKNIQVIHIFLNVDSIEVIFEESYDIHGRICIYNFEIKES